MVSAKDMKAANRFCSVLPNGSSSKSGVSHIAAACVVLTDAGEGD